MAIGKQQQREEKRIQKEREREEKRIQKEREKREKEEEFILELHYYKKHRKNIFDK